MSLRRFVSESNLIEGIQREPYAVEIDEISRLLDVQALTVPHLIGFVNVYQPGAKIRTHAGLNVRVGDHIAPPGGPEILTALESILARVNAHRGEVRGPDGAYSIHHDYEKLHPFTDGNGRSGRAVWLWQMRGHAPLGFLHHWYYQSLQMRRVQGVSMDDNINGQLVDDKINPVLGDLYDRGYANGLKAGREAGMREAARLLRDEDWQTQAINVTSTIDQTVENDYADAILAAIGVDKCAT